jgi:hypothetical protein
VRYLPTQDDWTFIFDHIRKSDRRIDEPPSV